MSDADRCAYVCQNPNCGATTYAPPGLIAIVCGHCGGIDLGTEESRRRWRNTVEVQAENKPEKPCRLLPIDPKDAALILAGLATLLAVCA
jgi:hypothetical protein